jgi:hypothetical protein
MNSQQIMEWVSVLLVSAALVSLIVFVWVLIIDICKAWRGQ